MSNLEIKVEIDNITERIEALLKEYHFVLVPEIATLLEEVNKLQLQCTHEYKDGECIYCGKIQGE